MRSDTDVGREGPGFPIYSKGILAMSFQSHTRKGLGLLNPMKGKCSATVYKGILYNCVLPTFWQHLSVLSQMYTKSRHLTWP